MAENCKRERSKTRSSAIPENSRPINQLLKIFLMKSCMLKNWFCRAMLVHLIGMPLAYAADAPAGIIGKSDWLFYRHELSDTIDMAATDQSIDLIRRFNKVLAANGVSMAVAMAPLKMRTYSEYLPDDVKVNDYMKGNYERMSKALQAGQVNVVDINTAFLNSPKRISATPLFYRLDTHWAPAGAMVAAEAVKAAADANPALKKVLDTVPEVKLELLILRRQNSKARDLTEQLPPSSPSFTFEQVVPIGVRRLEAPKQDLLGNGPAVGVMLMGSSYSHVWTGFPDALRYTLQRDLLSVSVGADQGSWVGMESYLRDDAFQTQPPKLLIWEIPERDMRAPPDYKFRETRYVSDNTEWLLRVSALVQTSCRPSAVSARLTTAGLTANVKGNELAVGPTNDGDFLEVSFDKPIGRLDYFAARVANAGSKTITMEASGPMVTTRRFVLNTPGDDEMHALKAPLPSDGGGFAKVRIYPGNSTRFALQGMRVCRQPEDLLN